MNRKDFSDDEWKALEFGPLWAFMAVAAQDGHLDPPEKEALVVALSSTDSVQGNLGREVMNSVSAAKNAVFQAWEADDRSPAEGFAAIVKVLAKVDADEANRYKGLLVWLAVEVARAGGTWRGGTVSSEERHAIEEVAQYLGFNVSEALAAADNPNWASALPR